LSPYSRKTIRVGISPADFSTHVHGSLPIIAERSMYWDNGTGEAGHDSIGMDSPHNTFYLPDGSTELGWQTWTLVGNPGTEDANITVNYYLQGGGVKTIHDILPAGTRRSYSMSSVVPNGQASVVVTSTAKITAESSMYCNNMGTGKSTIGGYRDSTF